MKAARKACSVHVVMLHHPPVTRGVKFGRGLTDARLFGDILRKHGAELGSTA